MLPVPEFIRQPARYLASLPGRFIPYNAQKPVLSFALNRAFREPLAHGELEFLEGKAIRIQVHDLSIDWLLSLAESRFVPLDREREADVRIGGESLDFALLATRQADPDALFFQRRIRIEGDTDLGLGVKNTMNAMDWNDLPVPLRKFLQALAVFLEAFVLKDPAADRGAAPDSRDDR